MVGTADNQFFYFFSSLAQSMAALFAIGGVFAVFRLQAIDSEISNAINKLKVFFSGHLDVVVALEINYDYECWLDESVEAHLRKAVVDATEKNSCAARALVHYYLSIKHLQNKRDQLKDQLKPINLKVGIIFVTSFFSLLLVTALLQFFSIAGFVILLVMAFICLFLTLILVIDIIKYIALVLCEPEPIGISTPAELPGYREQYSDSKLWDAIRRQVPSYRL